MVQVIDPEEAARVWQEMLDAAPDDRARGELIAFDEELKDALDAFRQGERQPFLSLYRASQEVR